MNWAENWFCFSSISIFANKKGHVSWSGKEFLMYVFRLDIFVISVQLEWMEAMPNASRHMLQYWFYFSGVDLALLCNT